MYRRVCVLVVALVFAASGLALANNDTLVIGSPAEAVGLDPRLEMDVPSFERIHVLMEALVKFETDMEFGPLLAKSWEISPDTKTLRFQLQDGVKWHDGVPFTAEDVKYTFDWVLDLGNAAPNRGLYEDIQEIEVVSDTEVVFRLSQPNSFLLNNIARMQITPKHDGDRTDFRQKPIGTGPYKLVSWNRDDRMTLVANEDYWGGKPNIANVVFRPIPENSTRLLAFEAGELDLFQGAIVPQEIDRLEADPKYIVQRAPGTGYNYVAFNCQVDALREIKVRQAFCYLINREGIVDRVLNGIGTPGVSPVSPALPWFNPDVHHYTYDLDKAKELFAEAGYGPGEVTLKLYTNEDPERMRMAEILQFEAQQVGVEIEIIIEEWGAFLARIQETDDFDLFILGWVGQLDPDRAMIRQFHSEGSQNNGYYTNSRVDYLLEQGRAVPPESQESLDYYGEAQEIIVQEAAYGFINYTEEVGLQHPWVENWEAHPYAAAAWQDAHRLVKNK